MAVFALIPDAAVFHQPTFPPPTFGPSFDNRDEDDGMELYIVIIRDSAKYYFTDLGGTKFCQKAIYGLKGY